MIVQEKLSMDEAIQHYGVKGMRWGVRRTDAQLSKAPQKAPQVKKVKQARLVDQSLGRGKRVRAARRSTLRTRAQMKQAELNVIQSNTKKGRSEAGKIAKQARQAHMNNPNRAEARKITIGEGIAAALFVPGVGLAAGLGVSVLAQKSVKESQAYRNDDEF